MGFVKFAMIGAVALIGLSSAASATEVVFDGNTSAGTPDGVWSNSAAGQNFLVQFTLSKATNVSGITIWTGYQFLNPGDAAVVKLASDVANEPDVSTLTVTNTTLSVADGAIDTAYFAPVTLAAGTYWIGLSATDFNEAGWASFDIGAGAPAPGQWQLNGDNPVYPPSISSLSFQVLGSAAPEPAAWALMMVGVGGMGAALRTRRRKAIAAA
jgi:hypothetical protein